MAGDQNEAGEARAPLSAPWRRGQRLAPSLCSSPTGVHVPCQSTRDTWTPAQGAAHGPPLPGPAGTGVRPSPHSHPPVLQPTESPFSLRPVQVRTEAPRGHAAGRGWQDLNPGPLALDAEPGPWVYVGLWFPARLALRGPAYGREGMRRRRLPRGKLAGDSFVRPPVCRLSEAGGEPMMG